MCKALWDTNGTCIRLQGNKRANAAANLLLLQICQVQTENWAILMGNTPQIKWTI